MRDSEILRFARHHVTLHHKAIAWRASLRMTMVLPGIRKQVVKVIYER
jgi:hypothetical protein